MLPNLLPLLPRGAGHDVWFLTLLLPGERALWLRWTVDRDASGTARPALWATWFEEGRAPVALHVEYSPAELERGKPLPISIGPGRLEAYRATGRLSQGGHELAWDLRLEGRAQSLSLVPPHLRPVGRALGAGFEPVAHDGLWSGYVALDGERIELAKAPGELAHLWGRRRRDAWTWLHCHAFAGAEAAMEGLAVELPSKREARLLRVRVGKRDYDATGGLQPFLTESEVRHAPDRSVWAFRTHAGHALVEGIATLPLSRAVQIRQTDPDGRPVWVVNGARADLSLRIVDHGVERVLEAPGTAHLEFASRRQDERLAVSIAA